MSSYCGDDGPTLGPEPTPAAGPAPLPPIAGPRRTLVPMEPVAQTGVMPVAPIPSVQPAQRPDIFGGTEVLVRELAAAQYTDRRVRFKEVAGSVKGIVQPLGLALRPDGSTSGRAIAQRLHLVDDRGEDHYLEFTATDRARILD